MEEQKRSHRYAAFLIVLLMIGGTAAGYVWARSSPEKFYLDTGRRLDECRVAADIAAELTAANGKEAEFRPLLLGRAPDTRPMSNLGSYVQLLFLWPVTFDCRDVFAARNIRSVDAPSAPWLYWSFSRIALSADGNTAYVAVSSSCGEFCASGSNDVWRRQGKRWVLIKRVGTWMS